MVGQPTKRASCGSPPAVSAKSMAMWPAPRQEQETTYIWRRMLESCVAADYGSMTVTVGRLAWELCVFKIMHLGVCPTSPMEPGRGEQIKLVNPALGTEKVDVHLNRLIPGGPPGKVHHHTR